MLAIKITALSLFGVYCLALLYRVYRAVEEWRAEDTRKDEEWKQKFYF